MHFSVPKSEHQWLSEPPRNKTVSKYMLTFTFAYKNRSQTWRKTFEGRLCSLCIIKNYTKFTQIITIIVVSDGSNTRIHVLYAKTNTSRAQRVVSVHIQN